MCRIFGFRSILQSGVHKSLMDADNAIIQQSDRHPDGWGVAYYHMGNPHLVKLDSQAKNCKIFERVSGLVTSNTVVTHIRKSTIGQVGPLNTHPFQFGPWVFAHNGKIQNFSQHRPALFQEISPRLQGYILGETDSEILFYFLLTQLEKKNQLQSLPEAPQVQDILSDALKLLESIVGPLVLSQGDYHQNYLTFVLTDGASMLAFQGGQELYYSTHKTLCSERSTCAHFGPLCEKKAAPGDRVHHLLVSSEMIQNENVWRPLDFRQGVLMDRNNRFSIFSL